MRACVRAVVVVPVQDPEGAWMQRGRVRRRRHPLFLFLASSFSFSFPFSFSGLDSLRSLSLIYPLSLSLLLLSLSSLLYSPDLAPHRFSGARYRLLGVRMRMRMRH